MKNQTLRTWIEIDAKALRANAKEFFRLIPSSTRLMAVIKSNAYGHGLVTIAREINKMPLFHKRGWFGVDSIVEALRLRREGITNPILVLGFTLASRMKDAAREQISISIANFDALTSCVQMPHRPLMHLKIDTGMHRQGFLKKDIPRLIRILKKHTITPQGIFTHFASAKDAVHPTYTHAQIAEFKQIVKSIEKAGIRGMIAHAAATSGTLLFPDAHLDMVRIGMGLYGYWPSEEIERDFIKARARKKSTIMLKPVLAWKTIIAEIKRIPKGSFVGYDLTEQMPRASTIAVLPIGYWHGFDRGLSSVGYVLIRGYRARILGRVSMDMVVIDITDIPRPRVGDEVMIVGIQHKRKITAHDMGRAINTSAYEIVTRINPLIKRIVI